MWNLLSHHNRRTSCLERLFTHFLSTCPFSAGWAHVDNSAWVCKQGRFILTKWRTFCLLTSPGQGIIVIFPVPLHTHRHQCVQSAVFRIFCDSMIYSTRLIVHGLSHLVLQQKKYSINHSYKRHSFQSICKQVLFCNVQTLLLVSEDLEDEASAMQSQFAAFSSCPQFFD